MARRLVGYAVVFNSPADIGGRFVERIRQGAFSRALRERQDVRALVNHDENRVIGRSVAGTLRLREDDKGLRVEIDLPDTSAGRDLAESVRRGDVSGMSFAFRTKEDRWDHVPGVGPVRTLIDLDLTDVSVVTFPAYSSTSVQGVP